MSGSLGDLNREFETSGVLAPEVWHEWLWGTDPEQSYNIDVLLNRNQLLGVLVCRFKHKELSDVRSTSTFQTSNDAQVFSRMAIMDKPVYSMTWRELKDTVANLLLEWPTYVERLTNGIRAHQHLRRVLRFVDECAARFGFFTEVAADESLLDDPSETQPCADRCMADKMVLTASSIRRMVASFLILYRHMHLLSVARKVQKNTTHALPISKFSWEASMDRFHELCMHMSLPVGARLVYRHDFPGMYNSVSQVVYFHNSQYTRTARHAVDDVATAPPIHVLPAIQELYPEIPLRLEEDFFDPTVSNGWYWLLIAGRVYLITPEPKILYSDSIGDLLLIYTETLKLHSDPIV